MMSFKNILNKVSILATGAFLIGCAQQGSLEVAKVQYQQKAVKSLANYANSVSRGFKSGSSSGTSRGVYDFDGSGLGSGSSSQPYQGYILRQAMETEVQDCVEMVTYIPTVCQNFTPMI